MVTFNTRYIFDRYFNGNKNFFTPNVYSYGHKKYGYKVLLYEKSKGKGLFGSDLYGLSCLLLNNETNEVQQIDLSKAFGSLKELDNYLETINADSVKEADLFGEVKIINS